MARVRMPLVMLVLVAGTLAQERRSSSYSYSSRTSSSDQPGSNGYGSLNTGGSGTRILVTDTSSSRGSVPSSSSGSTTSRRIYTVSSNSPSRGSQGYQDSARGTSGESSMTRVSYGNSDSSNTRGTSSSTRGTSSSTRGTSSYSSSGSSSRGSSVVPGTSSTRGSFDTAASRGGSYGGSSLPSVSQGSSGRSSSSSSRGSSVTSGSSSSGSFDSAASRGSYGGSSLPSTSQGSSGRSSSSSSRGSSVTSGSSSSTRGSFDSAASRGSYGGSSLPSTSQGSSSGTSSRGSYGTGSGSSSTSYGTSGTSSRGSSSSYSGTDSSLVREIQGMLRSDLADYRHEMRGIFDFQERTDAQLSRLEQTLQSLSSQCGPRQGSVDAEGVDMTVLDAWWSRIESRMRRDQGDCSNIQSGLWALEQKVDYMTQLFTRFHGGDGVVQGEYESTRGTEGSSTRPGGSQGGSYSSSTHYSSSSGTRHTGDRESSQGGSSSTRYSSSGGRQSGTSSGSSRGDTNAGSQQSSSGSSGRGTFSSNGHYTSSSGGQGTSGSSSSSGSQRYSGSSSGSSGGGGYYSGTRDSSSNSEGGYYAGRGSSGSSGGSGSSSGRYSSSSGTSGSSSGRQSSSSGTSGSSSGRQSSSSGSSSGRHSSSSGTSGSSSGRQSSSSGSSGSSSGRYSSSSGTSGSSSGRHSSSSGSSGGRHYDPDLDHGNVNFTRHGVDYDWRYEHSGLGGDGKEHGGVDGRVTRGEGGEGDGYRDTHGADGGRSGSSYTSRGSSEAGGAHGSSGGYRETYRYESTSGGEGTSQHSRGHSMSQGDQVQDNMVRRGEHGAGWQSHSEGHRVSGTNSNYGGDTGTWSHFNAPGYGTCPTTVFSISEPEAIQSDLATVMGSWMRDAGQIDDRIWVVEATNALHWNHMTEYSSLADYKERLSSQYRVLNESCTGLGAVVYRGHVYCQAYAHRRRSLTILKMELDSGAVEGRLRVAEHAGHGGVPYRGWAGIYLHAQLLVDETGLWVLAAESTTRRLLLYSLDPDTLEVTSTLRTGKAKDALGPGFLVCGVLYALDSHYAENVVYVFDTKTGLGHDVEPGELPFPHMDLAALQYSPWDRKLFVWRVQREDRKRRPNRRQSRVYGMPTLVDLHTE